MSVARSLQQRRARLVLYGPSPLVNEVFEHVSLRDLMPIVADDRGDRRDQLLSRPAVQTVSDVAASSPRAAQSLNPQAGEHSCLKKSRNCRIEVIQTVADLFAVHRYVPSTVAAEGRRSLTGKIGPSSTHVDDLVRRSRPAAAR